MIEQKQVSNAVSGHADDNIDMLYKCNKNSRLSDELSIKQIIFDFENEAHLYFTYEKVKEIITLLIKGSSFVNVPLSVVLNNSKLEDIFMLISKYFRLEICEKSIEQGILAFKLAYELLVNVPSSVYLYFIPTTAKKESCPLISLCSVFGTFIYETNQDKMEFDEEKLTNIILNRIDQNTSDNSEDENYNKNILIFNAILFIEIIFMTLDNSSYNYETDFLVSENFVFCSKFVLNTFFPLIQIIISSKIMIKQNGKRHLELNQLRIKIFKIFEIIISSFYKTNLLDKFVSILNSQLIENQCTIMESLMDILSPDFPNWYSKECDIELKSDFYIESLRLQYHALSFILVLCNYFEPTSMLNIILTVRKSFIPMDKLPDFISKNNLCFSDITEKFYFDENRSIFESPQEIHDVLPQYCNSIFSNLYYKIVSTALYNGLKLQQSTFDFTKIGRDRINKTIIGKETYNLCELYKLKLDIFLTNVRIIAFIFNSIITFSEKEISNKEHRLKYPLHQAITSLNSFLIWICEFVFDYKKIIPQFFNILEEINMIKIRMPILSNIFNYKKD